MHADVFMVLCMSMLKDLMKQMQLYKGAASVSSAMPCRSHREVY